MVHPFRVRCAADIATRRRVTVRLCENECCSVYVAVDSIGVVFVIRGNEKIPTKGGNIQIYQSVAGQIPCEEYTLFNYDCNLAAEFVALQLILDWNRPAPLSEQSPILSSEVTHVGISLILHR